MCDEERAYLERRVTEELDRAYHAVSPAAMKAHYGLLGLYLNQLHGKEDVEPVDAKVA